MDSQLTMPFERDGCAREAIHIPGSIQPHGFLFVLNAADLSVAAVSQNAAEVLGMSPLALVGRPIDDFLETATPNGLNADLQVDDGEAVLRVRFRQSGQSSEWDGLVHRGAGLILLELGAPIAADHADRLFGQVRRGIESIRRGSSADAACDALAAGVRQLTGFDRVMVYRFDPDWNGEVIAEDKAIDVHSYRGHAFPASDIPEQARALYLQNAVRLIPDAGYVPSPIIPAILRQTGQPIDLTNATLRSVSPIHLEYLANMGVVGSMSVSIVRDGRLWGLVACHHGSSRVLPYRVLQGCVLLAEALAWYLDTEERGAAADCVTAVRRLESALTAGVEDDEEYRARLRSHAPELLGLTKSQGLAICDGDTSWVIGQGPDHEQITALVRWLREVAEDRFVTDDLGARFAAARSYCAAASGIAAMPLANGWLIWFRAEWRHTLTWAGEAVKATGVAAHGGQIHPRKSFASWQQRIRGRSRFWAPSDLFAVDQLRALFDRHAFARERRGNLRFETLVRTTNDIVLWADAEGELYETLPQWKAYTGLDNASTKGRGWLRAIHPDDIALALELWERALTNRSLYQVEFRLRRHDGVYHRFAMRSVPILDTEGQVQEWIGTCTDINVQNEAKQLLKEINAALERRVEHRTIELAAANRELEAFAYAVSHDLRAPLRGMDGFSEALLEDFGAQLDPIAKNYLHRIRQASQRMAELIEGLLGLCGIGRMGLEDTDVSLSDLATDILAELQRGEPERRVRTEVQPGLSVRGDRRILRALLDNLLRNAWKFTARAADPLISFGASVTTSPPTYFVRDTGVGFDMAYSNNLFKPFQRLHSVGDFPGTGIGLATVSRIVNRYGGSVRADSRPGAGASFHFTLAAEAPS